MCEEKSFTETDLKKSDHIVKNLMDLVEYRVQKRNHFDDELIRKENILLRDENERLIRIIEDERNKCSILKQTNDILTDDLSQYTTENNDLMNLFNAEKLRNIKIIDENKVNEINFIKLLDDEKFKNFTLKRTVQNNEIDLSDLRLNISTMMEQNKQIKDELKSTIEDSKWKLHGKDTIISDLNNQLIDAKKSLQAKFGKITDEIRGEKRNNKFKSQRCTRCLRIANMMDSFEDDDYCLSPIGPSGITGIFIKQKKISKKNDSRKVLLRPKVEQNKKKKHINIPLK